MMKPIYVTGISNTVSSISLCVVMLSSKMKHRHIHISLVALLTVTSTTAICTNPSEHEPRTFKGCLNFSDNICYIYRHFHRIKDNKVSFQILEGQLRSNAENSTVDQCLYGQYRSFNMDSNETRRTSEAIDVFFTRPNQICVSMKLYNMSLHPPVLYLVVNSSDSEAASIQLISKKTFPDPRRTIWYTSIKGLTITTGQNIIVDDSWMSNLFIEHQKQKKYLAFASASITSELMRLECMVQNFQRQLKSARRSVDKNVLSEYLGVDDSDTLILVLVTAVVVTIFFVGSLINAVMNYLTLLRLRKANSAVGGCSLLYLFFPALILRIVSQKSVEDIAEHEYAECDFLMRQESVGHRKVADTKTANYYVASVDSNNYDVPRF